jgi:hypothetical protein
MARTSPPVAPEPARIYLRWLLILVVILAALADIFVASFNVPHLADWLFIILAVALMPW